MTTLVVARRSRVRVRRSSLAVALPLDSLDPGSPVTSFDPSSTSTSTPLQASARRHLGLHFTAMRDRRGALRLPARLTAGAEKLAEVGSVRRTHRGGRPRPCGLMLAALGRRGKPRPVAGPTLVQTP